MAKYFFSLKMAKIVEKIFLIEKLFFKALIITFQNTPVVPYILQASLASANAFSFQHQTIQKQGFAVDQDPRTNCKPPRNSRHP